MITFQAVETASHRGVAIPGWHSGRVLKFAHRVIIDDLGWWRAACSSAAYGVRTDWEGKSRQYRCPECVTLYGRGD